MEGANDSTLARVRLGSGLFNGKPKATAFDSTVACGLPLNEIAVATGARETWPSAQAKPQAEWLAVSRFTLEMGAGYFFFFAAFLALGAAFFFAAFFAPPAFFLVAITQTPLKQGHQWKRASHKITYRQHFHNAVMIAKC
jgi:hypothetical protein